MGLSSPQHGWTAEPAFLLGALLGSNYQEAAVFLAHQAAFLFVLHPALASVLNNGPQPGLGPPFVASSRERRFKLLVWD